MRDFYTPFFDSVDDDLDDDELDIYGDGIMIGEV